MNNYMLIFRDTAQNEATFAAMTPAEMQASLAKWGAWMGQLGAAGKMVSGEPLTPSGKVIHGTAKKVTDGPFMESKEIVGGYLIITAASLEEGVELAKGCPALETKTGTVEVREIQKLQQA